MRHIFRYPIYVSIESHIYMPHGAMILSVQVQDGQLCLWADVNTDNSSVRRRILVVGTGSNTPAAIYLATVQMGSFVWHVFDAGEAL